FPRPIAPFEACLVPIGYHKSAAVRAAAEKLYAELAAAGIDVLLEDREERPGVLFADMDLLGIPHRLVLSERGLAAGSVEYKGRTQAAAQDAPLGSALAFLQDKLASA
ncbi:MAG: His/Gly/Thr/Pro-type tRNA ligase C-terminal domain-containing protein, partial [Terriglobales bacterium]